LQLKLSKKGLVLTEFLYGKGTLLGLGLLGCLENGLPAAAVAAFDFPIKCCEISRML